MYIFIVCFLFPCFSFIHILACFKNFKCLFFPGFLPSPEEFAEIHHDMKGIGK